VSSSSRRQSRDDYGVRQPGSSSISISSPVNPYTAPATSPASTPSLVPQRAAPAPPVASTSYGPRPANSSPSNQRPSESPAWVLPDQAGNEKAPPASGPNAPSGASPFRQSSSTTPKPARSSYIAGSRPPFSPHNSSSQLYTQSTSPSVTSSVRSSQSSSPRPSFPISSSTSTPSSTPLTSPQRNPASYIPTGLGGPWEIVEEEVDGEDKRPAPQLTHVPQPSGGDRDLSLLTDPATAAAAEYSTYTSAPSEPASTAMTSQPPPLQPHEYGLPQPDPSQVPVQYLQQSTGLSGSTELVRKRRSQSFGDRIVSRSDKGGNTIKGVLGSFFGGVGGTFGPLSLDWCLRCLTHDVKICFPTPRGWRYRLLMTLYILPMSASTTIRASSQLVTYSRSSSWGRASCSLRCASGPTKRMAAAPGRVWHFEARAGC
jgi:hypothetical protein